MTATPTQPMLSTTAEIVAAYRELATRIVGHAEYVQELFDIAEYLEEGEE